MTRNKLILLLLAMALSVWIASHSWSYMTRCRDDAEKFAGDLAECEKYAAGLASTTGTTPPPRSSGAEDIRTAAEKLADESGIKQLKSVDQRPDRRLGDTSYKERPYTIRLLKVSPAQVASFAHGLSVLKGLRTSSINMQADLRDSAQDLWNVDLEFSYLIYDPVDRER